MMTLEEAICECTRKAEANRELAKYNKSHVDRANDLKNAEECEQLAAWLRELQERRKAPEIVRCDECTHYIPILSNWGKCGVHSSPTEKYRTCQICDYCSWAEKREEKSKWVKNPLSTL